MHQSLKQFLMYASLIALVGTTACSTLEASFGADEGDGGSATHASSGDILQSMARDSEAGGE
jgi:hypothetical protein